MKATVIILTGLVFILSALVFVTLRDSKYDIKELQRSITREQKIRDSLIQINQAILDSLVISRKEISDTHQATERANRNSLYWKNRYENIHYTPLANDRVRDSLWSVLYPGLHTAR